jgi:hypothetical protein
MKHYLLLWNAWTNNGLRDLFKWSANCNCSLRGTRTFFALWKSLGATDVLVKVKKWNKTDSYFCSHLIFWEVDVAFLAARHLCSSNCRCCSCRSCLLLLRLKEFDLTQKKNSIMKHELRKFSNYSMVFFKEDFSLWLNLWACPRILG